MAGRNFSTNAIVPQEPLDCITKYFGVYRRFIYYFHVIAVLHQ